MDRKPVYTFAKWQVKDGELPAVLSLLAELMAKSTAEEGSLLYEVHQTNSDVNNLILFEGYTDETALTQHRQSEHYQRLVTGKIIPLLVNREIVITKRLTSTLAVDGPQAKKVSTTAR